MPRQRKGESEIITEGTQGIVVFKGKEVRRVIHDNEWYFSVVDVVQAITDSSSPRRYWTELKSKLRDESGDELFAFIEQLKMPSADGKHYATDAANVETMFRIIQSIPSKKAEPIKRWLARTGYERILEQQNPDIAIKRSILEYKAKGRSDDWIEARISCIMTRDDLTQEWMQRGIKDKDYGILTNLIHEQTFDISIKRHQGIKGLMKNHSLRDHMSSRELLFTRLGEASTKDIAVARDAQGYWQNRAAAQAGGQISGNARKALEKQTGEKVVSESNYLPGKDGAQELTEG